MFILTESLSIEKGNLSCSCEGIEGRNLLRGVKMGYILPIQHDGYQQYVNRSLYAAGRYSHIQPTTAIQASNTYRQEEKNQHDQQFAAVLACKMKTVKTNKAVTTAAGKGNLFNASV